MRTVLEIIRIIIILGILGAVGWTILGELYSTNGANEAYSWVGAIAILIILFILYRNKLQFSGWYKGKGMVKLPKPVTTILIGVAILLIILPYVFGSLFR